MHYLANKPLAGVQQARRFPTNLPKLKQSLTFQPLPQIDPSVQVGQNQRVPCRLITIQMDEQTAAQRIRKLREYARKKQVTLSAERLVLAHWTLLLTNAPQDLLSLVEVYALLRLRWQIERLFRL